MHWAVTITLFALAVEPPATLPAFSPEHILLNMPVNSDHRCVGISLMTAALLEGELIADDRADEVRELGAQIYGAAFVKRRVRFRAKLRVGERDEPIQSRMALEALSTAVADQYKQRHFASLRQPRGERRAARYCRT